MPEVGTTRGNAGRSTPGARKRARKQARKEQQTPHVQSRSDAAQRTGATTPKRPRAHKPKTAAGEASRPENRTMAPVTVVKRKNKRPVAGKNATPQQKRTFPTVEHYKAYEDRLHAKKVIRGRQTALRRATRTDPETGDVERQTRIQRTEKEIAEKVEKIADRRGRKLARKHDRQIRRGQAPSGGTSERALIENERQRLAKREQRTVEEEKAKRRGGGLGQLLENAKDEAVDTVAGAPAAAVELAKVVHENQPGTRGPANRGKRHTKAAVKAVKETSPAYALAQGDIKEALGRAKERPLSAAGEALLVGGAAAKPVQVAKAAAHARETGVSTGQALKAQKVAKRARPALRVDDTPRKRQAAKQTRAKARHERESTRERARAQAEGRAQARPGATDSRDVQRRYAANPVVRGAQKTTDRAKAHVGINPNQASKRQTRRARKRRFDADVRNLQAGGIGREEVASRTTRKATKGTRRRDAHAYAVQLRQMDAVRDGHELADLKAVRATLAKHDDPKVPVVDRLIADLEKNGRKAAIHQAREPGRKLAQESRAGDTRQSEARYAEPERLDFTRRLQGPLLRGEVRPRQGGGEGETPPSTIEPDFNGRSRRSPFDDAKGDQPTVTLHESAGVTIGRGSAKQHVTRTAPDVERRRQALARAIRADTDRIAELRGIMRRNPHEVALKKNAAKRIEKLSSRVEQMENQLAALERELPDRGDPSGAHEATLGGDLTRDPGKAPPGRAPAGQKPGEVVARKPASKKARKPAARAAAPDQVAGIEPSLRPDLASGRHQGNGDSSADADRRISEAGYEFDDGTPVTLRELEARGHGDVAGFLRGTKADPSEDRTLGAPKAGEGYTIDDLLGPLDRKRPHDSAVERERRITLAQLEDAVIDRHSLRGTGPKPDGYVEVPRRGGQTAVMPEYLAKRLKNQLDDPSRMMRLGRWGTRLAIRATLPFSVLWHAGNIIDLQIRLATTLTPGGIADGAAIARILERQLEDLSPDLRHQVLDSLKGHFGSRHTVRRPRASDVIRDTRLAPIGRLTNAVGDFLHNTLGRITDQAFDVASDMEQIAVRTALGAEARDYARQLGLHINDVNQQMAGLAKVLEKEPGRVHELQDRVLEIVGDFATKSPTDRVMLAGIDPFWQWLKASTKFVLHTLPVQHPKRTAMLLIAARLTADERAKAGLNYYWDQDTLDRLHRDLAYDEQRTGFLAGALGEPGADTVTATAPFTSFGEVAGILTDPSRQAGRFLSYLQRPAAAAGGYYRTPAEVALRALPGGGEIQDLEHHGDSAKRASNMAAESILPGSKQVRQFGERGGHPTADSTFIDPKSYGGGDDAASGLQSVGNPFFKRPAPQSALTKEDLDRRTPFAEPGQTFIVRYTDRSGRVRELRVRRTR